MRPETLTMILKAMGMTAVCLGFLSFVCFTSMETYKAITAYDKSEKYKYLVKGFAYGMCGISIMVFASQYFHQTYELYEPLYWRYLAHGTSPVYDNVSKVNPDPAPTDAGLCRGQLKLDHSLFRGTLLKDLCADKSDCTTRLLNDKEIYNKPVAREFLNNKQRELCDAVKEKDYPTIGMKQNTINLYLDEESIPEHLPENIKSSLPEKLLERANYLGKLIGKDVKYTKDPSKADRKIRFVPPETSTKGQRPNGWIAVNNDEGIELNSKWKYQSKADEIKLLDALQHELLHGLGLHYHTDNPYDLMYHATHSLRQR